MDKGEFTSAGVDIPLKLLKNRKTFEMLNTGNLQPIHLQIYPTNVCNLNCDFCLCDDRNRNDTLDIKEIRKFVDLFEDSLMAITVAGGGEPFAYKDLPLLVDLAHEKNIEIGVTTNGTLIGKKQFDQQFFDKLTWCRISVSEFSIAQKLFEALDAHSHKFDNCDLGFNWVCTRNFERDVQRIKKLINSYNDLVKYIKLADDAFLGEARAVKILERLRQDGYNTDKIVVGEYSKPGIAAKYCKIWKIRPVITADGNIYPCCGLPYVWNKKTQLRDFPEEVKLGNIKDSDLQEIFNREYFDGTDCKTCFYDGYNKLIAKLEHKEVNHINFI